MRDGCRAYVKNENDLHNFYLDRKVHYMTSMKFSVEIFSHKSRKLIVLKPFGIIIKSQRYQIHEFSIWIKQKILLAVKLMSHRLMEKKPRTRSTKL